MHLLLYMLSLLCGVYAYEPLTGLCFLCLLLNGHKNPNVLDFCSSEIFSLLFCQLFLAKCYGHVHKH